MTTVYLIRHGESLGNIHQCFAGSSDLELTQKGQEQARRLADFLQEIPIDCIYSSDLSRAVATIAPTAIQKGLKVQLRKELREINGGDWEKKLFTDLPKEYPEAFRIWKEDMEQAVCTNGESVRELSERIGREIRRIVLENKEKKIIISTHATPIRTFLAQLLHRSLREVEWVPNASVTTVLFDGTEFTVEEIGRDDFQGELSTTLSKNV